MDTVLVIGVDEAVCNPVCASLRDSGISVHCTRDAGSAFARIVSAPAPDVIVTGGGFSDVATFARRVTPTAAVVVIGGEALGSDQLVDAITQALGSYRSGATARSCAPGA